MRTLNILHTLQDFHRLKTAAAQFRPPASKTANILLLGAVGSGKSSFVSSVDSLFEGRVSRLVGYTHTTILLYLSALLYL